MRIVKTEFLEDGAKVRYTYEDGSSTVEDVTEVEIKGEPTQLDRIEANMDYLVLLNS